METTSNNIILASKLIFFASKRAKIQIEDDRTGISIETLKRAIDDSLSYIQGKNKFLSTPHDYYMALAYTIRDRAIETSNKCL